MTRLLRALRSFTGCVLTLTVWAAIGFAFVTLLANGGRG